MKILQSDGSPLMDISDVKIVDGQIQVSGKIMGAMPMKAIVKPSEMRKLMRQIGFVRCFRMGWLALFGSK